MLGQAIFPSIWQFVGFPRTFLSHRSAFTREIPSKNGFLNTEQISKSPKIMRAETVIVHEPQAMYTAG